MLAVKTIKYILIDAKSLNSIFLPNKLSFTEPHQKRTGQGLS